MGTKAAHFRTGECPPSEAPLPPSSPSAGVAGAEVPLSPLFAPEAGVVADVDCVQLALQLQPARVTLARELARLEGCLHGAAGLGVVRAVVEAALRRQLLDVRERLVQTSAVP